MNLKQKKKKIFFFKEIKPEIFSKLIFFVSIFNVESRRPMGSSELQKKYFQNELEKLTFFFSNHLEFYQYYRMKSTFLDDKFFMRGKEDIHLYHDSLMFYVDPDFSTSHDFIVAQIIANDKLEVYFNRELEALSMKVLSPSMGQTANTGIIPFQWTDNKTVLVELIFALCAAGSVNNGSCGIKELTALFEQIFNVRLTDTFRTFLEIKARTVPTRYMDHLKTTLLRKMEEDI